MSGYALIKNGLVINTIVWEGPDVSPMDFGEGVTYAQMPDASGNNPSAGWTFKDGVFAPPPPTEEEITAQKNARVKVNVAQKDSLMTEATKQVSVLQDAVDLDMATENEKAALPLWKKYRVLLNRIDANTPDEIAWPAKPA